MAGNEVQLKFDVPAVLRKWPSLENRRRTDGTGPYLVVDATLDVRIDNGVIAAVASLLAKNDINIAGLDLGRNVKRGKAVMLMQIDEPASDALIEEIRTSAGLETLRQVRL